MPDVDVIIRTNHALKYLACNDYVCCSLDVIGSVSSAVGLVLGNLSDTKHLTSVTGSVTLGCRSVSYSYFINLVVPTFYGKAHFNL